MKIANSPITFLAVILAAALVVAGCSKQEDTTPAKDTAAPAATQTAQIAQKICPVMGGAIDKNMYTDYQGRRIYFCCAACKPKFSKQPDKYLAKLDAQLKKP